MTISIASVIGINVILAISLNLISGFCGQVSLGHARVLWRRRLCGGAGDDEVGSAPLARWPAAS